MKPENVVVLIPIYIVKKIQKKSLTNAIGVSNLSRMAGEHSPDKACCACWIDRATYRQLKRQAEQTGKTITDLVEGWIYEQVKDVELTAEDFREIAIEVERARGRVSTARAKKAARKNGKGTA